MSNITDHWQELLSKGLSGNSKVNKTLEFVAVCATSLVMGVVMYYAAKENNADSESTET
jgi:hypothetical protein